jgi:hypothetical protein
MDHFYFGPRNTIFGLLESFSHLNDTLIADYKKDPHCDQCYGLECIQWNYMKTKEIKYVDDEEHFGNICVPYQWDHPVPAFYVE